jgi:hypothetical protein
MIINNSFFIITIFLVVLLSSLCFNSTFAYLDQEANANTSLLYLPFPYLQYGPSPNLAIILYFNSAYYSQGNETIEIFNPNTRIDNLTEAVPLFHNDNIQPSFDSYFIFNRLEEQVIPKLTEISVELYSILNPLEVEHITQAELGVSIPLSADKNNTYMPSFSIPSSLDGGYYIIKLSAYLPEYKIHVVYLNVIHLYPMDAESPLSSFDFGSNSTSRFDFGSNSTSPFDFGSNSTLTSLSSTNKLYYISELLDTG